MSLSGTRHRIRKIEPSRPDRFDTQFWPVLIALCMTGAIAGGAACSLLRGPWMWASLIILPITLATAITALHRLHDGVVRRSLQFAVLVSAAVHLLLLAFFGVINIFSSNRMVEKPTAEKPRPERVLLVSQRDPQPVWRELNRRETADPKLEPEREPTRIEQREPQPIEVEQPKPTDNPQANRRDQSATSVPHFDQSLSQLRRSTGEEKLQSLAPTEIAASAPTAKPSPTAAQPSETSANRSAAESTLTQTTTVEATSPSESSAASNERREIAQSKPTSATSEPTTARLRNRQTDVPIASVEEAVAMPTPTRVAEPSPAARERTAATARSERPARELQPSATDLPQPQLSERTETALANRRETQPSPPTLTQEDAPRSEPRRSNTLSEKVASLNSAEAPSTISTPTTGTTAQPQAANTSMTRSNTDSALASVSKNLQSGEMTLTGIAANASDSAARRRSESKADVPATLTAQQSSTQRRSTAQDRNPESAWQVNTELTAKLGGARKATERTSESSAASADSASSDDRSLLAAEVGSSEIDTGPTKLVAERAAERSGGGGARSLGSLDSQPESHSRSESTARSSSLMANNVDPTQSLRASPSQSSQNSTTQPEATAITSTREGGSQRQTGQPHLATESGAVSDFETSNAAEQLASSQRRESGNQNSNSEMEPSEDEENRRGNARSSLSRAPETSSAIQLAGTEGESNQTSGRPAASDAELASSSSRKSSRGIDGAAAEMETSSGQPNVAAASRRRSDARTPSDSSVAENGSGQSSERRQTNSPGLTDNVTVELAGEPTAHRGSEQGRAAAADVASDRDGRASMLDVVAEEGPAGLGSQPDEALGINTRPATRNSQNLQLNADSRFNRSDSSSMPATVTDAVLAKEAFESRGDGTSSAQPSTEAAIELGLEFLARYQKSDGSWSLESFDTSHPQHAAQLQSDSAATGLAVLAFQGAGFNHREFKYAVQLNRAISWLIEHQAPDGGLYVDSDARSNLSCHMYSHAIATLALTEAYGMTQDPALREPCRKALDYIVATQHKAGGWRYYADPARRETDTSVTGWMMMAMQSGRLVDLQVSEKTWKGIDSWLEVAHDPTSESLHRYNPYAENEGTAIRATGRVVSHPMTAVGLLMRLYTGWNRTDQRMLAGADYLLSQLPGDRTNTQRDTYYWYYATQVLRHVGGERWDRWNGQLHPLLINSQIQSGDMAGSWHPYEPIPDRWGGAGGRLYVTTMNLLSLEVNHRLLPLYEKTTR